jgi:hypothetical protein
MPDNDLFRSIRQGLKNLSTLTAAIISLLPGLSYFVHYAPPLFTPTALFSSGLGLAVFVAVFSSKQRRNESVRRGSRAIVAAVLLASIYGILFSQLTVGVPEGSESTHQGYQIGFGTYDFSLTPAARDKKREYDLRTPEELMLAFGGYEQGATNLIWYPWTIVSAGILLIFLFVSIFLLWAYGLASLARSLAKKEKLSSSINH